MKNFLLFISTFLLSVVLATIQPVNAQNNTGNDLPASNPILSEDVSPEMNVQTNWWNTLFSADTNSALSSSVALDEITETINDVQNKTDELQEQLDALNNKVGNLCQGLISLENNSTRQINSHQNMLADTNAQLGHLRDSIQDTQAQLDNKISANARSFESKILAIINAARSNTRKWIAAVTTAILLSLLLFFLLRKKLIVEKTGLTGQVHNLQRQLAEESVKLDHQLTELLEKQLKAIESTRQADQQVPQQPAQEVDHSLALKVADEIVRIQKNLSNMDPATKGLKQLNAAVRRIQDNFEAKGYELVELLGKPYHEGMKADADFRPDDNLKPGEQIITRIIKPTVNYNGVMIQAGHIEVSINE